MNALSRLFGWAAVAIGLLYIFALGLWAIGTYGLFGQEADPLSGLFLMPLGLPWNRMGEGPDVALAAPLANIAILWLLSSMFKTRR